MNRPWIHGAVFSLGSLLIVSLQVASAQQSPTAIATARQGYMWSQLLNFLNYPKVQKEIEMVPEQIEKINKLRTKLNDDRRTFYKDAAKLPAEDRQKAVQDAYAKSQVAAAEEMAEILLPHQMNRLKELALQFSMQSSLTYSLTQAEVADVMEISEKQLAELRKKELDLNREMAKKAQEFYAKLRAENREQLMNVLTDEQRRKLKMLLGDKFEWSTASNR